jgi:hypothetical protein
MGVELVRVIWHEWLMHMLLLGYSGLVGMVAGHACAGLVDLSRLERHIARLNAEELPPQVRCWHVRRCQCGSQLVGMANVDACVSL